MLGDIVKDDGEVFVVVFDGDTGGRERAAQAPAVPPVDDVKPPQGHRGQGMIRRRIEAVLPTRQAWASRDLMAAVEAESEPTLFWSALQHLRRNRVITSPARGIVQLRRGLGQPEAA